MREMERARVDEAGEAGEATDLLRITSRLIGVLEREVEMLREMDPTQMQTLQEEKIFLAAAYEAHLKQLHDDPGRLDDLDQDLRAELREVTRHFQTALSENERALRAAKEATDGLLGAIVEAVRKQGPQSPYSAAGALESRGEKQHTPLALDQRL